MTTNDGGDWPDLTGPDGTRFSFRRFHPTDHWPWQPRCRQLYGGWRWHLRVAWRYHRKQQVEYRLVRPWWRWTLCKAGVHRTVVGHVDNGAYRRGFFVSCWFCGWDRPATEDEWFHYPGDGGVLGG